jgi:hypothetical protein
LNSMPTMRSPQPVDQNELHRLVLRLTYRYPASSSRIKSRDDKTKRSPYTLVAFNAGWYCMYGLMRFSAAARATAGYSRCPHFDDRSDDRQPAHLSGQSTIPRDLPDDGGAEGNRTPDLLIANEALSQLSYSPIAGHGAATPIARGAPNDGSLSLSQAVLNRFSSDRLSGLKAFPRHRRTAADPVCACDATKRRTTTSSRRNHAASA